MMTAEAHAFPLTGNPRCAAALAYPLSCVILLPETLKA